MPSANIRKRYCAETVKGYEEAAALIERATRRADYLGD